MSWQLSGQECAACVLYLGEDFEPKDDSREASTLAMIEINTYLHVLYSDNRAGTMGDQFISHQFYVHKIHRGAPFDAHNQDTFRGSYAEWIAFVGWHRDISGRSLCLDRRELLSLIILMSKGLQYAPKTGRSM